MGALIQKDLCPSLPIETRASWKEKMVSLRGIIAPSILMILVLGSILSGATTPTEAAGVGVVGAWGIGIFNRRLNWKMVIDSAWETLEITAMVGWIVAAASAFSSVFAGVGGNQLVMEIATSLPGGRWGVLVAAIVFVFFLGMFLEPTAMIMLAAPILSPLLTNMGFDPLWWGLLFMLLLQVAYISPPFGFSLYYLKGVTPSGIPIEEIFKASIPFISVQLTTIFLIILFPGIALWISNQIM